MVKPSRSRTSLFSQWGFDTNTSGNDSNKSSNSTNSPCTTSDPYSPRDHHTFSPSTTTSTPFASPSLFLSSDPFRYSLALPAPYTSTSSSPYYKEVLGSGNESPYGGLAEDDTDDDHSQSQQKGKHPQDNTNKDPSYQYPKQNRYGPHPDAVKSTESLVSGTATTPKITLASPSTTTMHHYLFPDPAQKTDSNLDPSAARKIARSISRRHLTSPREVREEREKAAEEEERLAERKKLESAFPDPPNGKPPRPTRRVVSSSTIRVDTERNKESGGTSAVVRKDEKHPLSMRTLRRQPSMADLGNKNVKLGDPIDLRSSTKGSVSRPKPDSQSGQVSGGWKGIHARRESEAWRELVSTSGWDTSAPAAAVTPDLVSPMTRSFPSNIHDHGAPPSSVRSRHVSPPTLRSQPDPVVFDHPQAGLPPHSPSTWNTNNRDRSAVTPIYPAPYIGDEIQVSQSPVYSYSQLDFSISTASGMSRYGTLGSTRLDSIPMSVEMERDVPRSGLGSYDSGKLAARADALRRLSGFPGTQSSGEGPALRRTVSFKKESKKDKRSTAGDRPRAYSLSAKMAREIGISSPVPVPMPTTSKRETLSPSRGIYLGDLSVDMGGRYGDRQSTSPVSSGGTSLYPASSTSSYFPRQSTGRPLHPALSSEISLLAPSSIGLGFSPVGTPVSLPESLRAEAIDLTGDHDIPSTRFNRLPKRTSSLHYLRAGSPTAPVPEMPTPVSPESMTSRKEEPSLPSIDKPRRSFLLAQNTFYIPPLVAPPSLRSSRSLSNLHPPSTPTTPLPPLKPNSAYTKRSHNRRGTGAFGICSPNSIDPLPLTDHTSPLSLSSVPPSIRLERKRSSPFLNASASIRMMFSPIARSLSKSFDREPSTSTSTNAYNLQSSTLKSKISGPVENDGERMWREGLLREAVTASLGASVSNSEPPRTNPKSRLAIPRQLLEASVDVDQSHLEVEVDGSCAAARDGQRDPKIAGEINATDYPWATLQDSPSRLDDSGSLYSHYTPPRSRSTTMSNKRKSRPPTPSVLRLGAEASLESDLPPLPTEGDLSRLYQSHGSSRNQTESSEAFQSGVTVLRKPTPYYSRAHNGRVRGLGMDATLSEDSDSDEDSLAHDTAPPSYLGEINKSFDQTHLSNIATGSSRPTTNTVTETKCLARSVRSLSTSLRPRLSKPKLNLPEPVSSTTPVPVAKILSALSAREAGQRRAAGGQAHGPGDKERKIKEWRTEVEENGDLARLEERIIKHVERERETLRDMGRREGSGTSSHSGDLY